MLLLAVPLFKNVLQYFRTGSKTGVKIILAGKLFKFTFIYLLFIFILLACCCEANMFFLITQLYFILNKHLQEIHLVHNQQLRIITTRLDNLAPKFTAIRTILNKLVPNRVVFSMKYINVDTYKRNI